MTNFQKMTILAKYICVRMEIAPKRLKLEKIWFNIPIGLELAYLQCKNYFLFFRYFDSFTLKNRFEDDQFSKNDDFS